MKLFLIAIESGRPGRDDVKMGEELKKLGDECHTLANVWIVKSRRSAMDVASYIKDKVVYPADKFIVTELRGKWIAHNARRPDECFED